MQTDGCGDDRPGPVGGTGQVGGSGDFTLLHFEEQARTRRPTGSGVGLVRVDVTKAGSGGKNSLTFSL